MYCLTMFCIKSKQLNPLTCTKYEVVIGLYGNNDTDVSCMTACSAQYKETENNCVKRDAYVCIGMNR